jgi:hypothetical protein
LEPILSFHSMFPAEKALPLTVLAAKNVGTRKVVTGNEARMQIVQQGRKILFRPCPACGGTHYRRCVRQPQAIRDCQVDLALTELA